MVKIFINLLLLTLSYGFRFMKHPLEPRILYIYDCENINKLSYSEMGVFKYLFHKHPLLIFKGFNEVSPKDFLNFVKNFDIHYDKNALENPDDNDDQMLQPFDQFPDCKHVAPRGNAELVDFYNIKNINVSPYDAFINNYVWHTDILGHEYKLPNVITAFYIVEQPVIGGDTDFISGETIYENLTPEEQIASKNILMEINRRKFVTNNIEIDYAGVVRSEDYIEQKEGTTQIPLVTAPDESTENFRVLLMPTFFEKVVGWSVKESRIWIQDFMLQKVLPHRVSIQWKKGDLAVFNNRRFMHSSTPARFYTDNKLSSKRLLLQTFIPTKRPLYGVKPSKNDVYACYNVKWIRDQEKSIISAHNCIKYAENMAYDNNSTITENGFYILKK